MVRRSPDLTMEQLVSGFLTKGHFPECHISCVCKITSVIDNEMKPLLCIVLVAQLTPERCEGRTTRDHPLSSNESRITQCTREKEGKGKKI